MLVLILRRIYAVLSFFFFFNDTAPTEIYTLSLHDALPISCPGSVSRERGGRGMAGSRASRATYRDRKSTRLNSSHLGISYAVFCLKKKKKHKKKQNKKNTNTTTTMQLITYTTDCD